MNKDQLKKLVRESWDEVLTERATSKKQVVKESLRKIVKKVLSEITNVTKPEPTKEEKETIDKGYKKTGNERLDATRAEMMDQLSKIVKEIDKDFLVYWDDHNDLNVDAKPLLRVRISQTAEDMFNIEAMVNLDDRVRAIALTWEQVKNFVKANFQDVEDTKVDQAREKAMNHLEDKSDKSDLPQHNKPKRKEVGDTKNDEKDYNEKAVKKDEDQPNQPMKTVDEKDIKHQRDFKETENKVKPLKHKVDKKLVVNPKKTPKLK